MQRLHITEQAVQLTHFCAGRLSDATWRIEEFMVRAAGVTSIDIDHLSQEFSAIAARSSSLPPGKRWEESN